MMNVTMTPPFGGDMTSDAGFPNMTSAPVYRMQPYSQAHLLSVSIVLGLIILSTIVGNVFVIAAIILERNLQCVANYLIASLAVADLMVAAMVMPLAVVDEVSQYWFLGPELCDMYISFDVLCCTSSILHLVAIALDRYWAITRINYIRNRSAKRILLMIFAIWVISASISMPALFGWKNSAKPHETGVCLISQDWGYTIFSTVGAFYLPLLVMMIIYLKIYNAAKSRIRRKKWKKKCEQVTSCATEGVSLTNATSVYHYSEEDSTNISPSGVNGDLLTVNDSNYNTNNLSISPPPSPLMRSSNHILQISKVLVEGKKGLSPASNHTKDRLREKLEQKRERKAARTLAIITGSFIVCWLPFFIVAIVRPFCGNICHYPAALIRPIVWLGYVNSLLNPIIYTIFNPDFRMAFQKILFGKYRHRSVIYR